MTDQHGVWRCSRCGETNYPLTSAWRWSGECWEHRCAGELAQCGHVPASKVEPSASSQASPSKVPPIGTRIRVDEVVHELTITEFRETEVVAVADNGYEFRIDPRDFFQGKARRANE